MKKYFLLSLVLSTLSLLHAQTSAPAPAGYAIGTIDNPVTVLEYFTFLIDSSAPELEATLDDVEADFIGDAAVFNIPIVVVGDPGSCQFLLQRGTESNVISAVPTIAAQSAFNNWRKNPTSDELFDYLDDQYKSFHGTVPPAQISACKTAAATIKEKYPDAPLFGGLTVFSGADSIASTGAPSKAYYFVNENNQAVVTIPGIHLPDLQQSKQRGEYQNTSAGQVSFISGPHRPQSIQVN